MLHLHNKVCFIFKQNKLMLLLQWTIVTGFRFGTRRHHIVSSSRHANCRTLVSISFLLATSCRRVSKSNSSTYRSLTTAFYTVRYSQNNQNSAVQKHRRSLKYRQPTDRQTEETTKPPTDWPKVKPTGQRSDNKNDTVKCNCFGSSKALENKSLMGFLTR